MYQDVVCALLDGEVMKNLAVVNGNDEVMRYSVLCSDICWCALQGGSVRGRVWRKPKGGCKGMNSFWCDVQHFEMSKCCCYSGEVLSKVLLMGLLGELNVCIIIALCMSVELRIAFFVEGGLKEGKTVKKMRKCVERKKRIDHF